MLVSKVLCVCHAGMVRSVAMTWALKARGLDSIAIGINAHSDATKQMMFEWADLVVVMESAIKIPDIYQPKTVIVDVGPDRFHTPSHPELQSMVHQATADLFGEITPQ